jgi:S1-C subfamily serine protease
MNNKWVPKWVEKTISDENWDRMPYDVQKQNTSLRTHRLLYHMMNKEAQKREADPIENAIQSVLPSVGTVWIKSPKETWNGSGFLMPNNRFATAAHVIEQIPNDAKILVTFDQEKYINAKIIATDKTVDFGLLILEEVPENITPLKFAHKEDIQEGQQIAVIGSPSGWHNITTVGRVSAIGQNFSNSNDISLKDMILIDADIDSGSSGSPVIDVNGNVIGIVMAIIGKNSNIGIGQRAVSPSYKIYKIIEKKFDKLFN